MYVWLNYISLSNSFLSQTFIEYFESFTQFTSTCRSATQEKLYRKNKEKKIKD